MGREERVSAVLRAGVSGDEIRLAQQNSFSPTLAFPSGNICPGVTGVAAVTLPHSKDMTPCASWRE